MSEVINPLFENEREFLERQKEEYKSALMGDVDHIKNQGQEVGKKVAVAGGIFLAGYLLKRAFTSDEKKRERKLKKSKKKSSKHSIPVTTELAHDPYELETHETNNLSSEYISPAAKATRNKSNSKKVFESDFAKVITSQAVALLMMYITKKVEEHLNSVSKNNDIATEPAKVQPTETTTEYNVPIEDAI